MGRPPTHIDSHHNAHRRPEALPEFILFARRHGLPLREHSPARYFSKFYGQWGGQTHLEQISTESLARMLETEIEEGITELSCHPGLRRPGLSRQLGRRTRGGVANLVRAAHPSHAGRTGDPAHQLSRSGQPGPGMNLMKTLQFLSSKLQGNPALQIPKTSHGPALVVGFGARALNVGWDLELGSFR